MRIVIADDEPLARDGLRLRLERLGGSELVADCENGPDAVAAILRERPDLVFLDINMPGCDGIEVVERVGTDVMPLVVFLTAYDEHAIEAFRINALDYLLKPVSDARLAESLERARAALSGRAAVRQQTHLANFMAQMGSGEAQRAPSADGGRLMIRAGGHVHFLRLAEIRWVEAYGDYVNVHTDERTHLVRETLRSMEGRLEARGFQRIHRSSLVNLDRIRELVALESGDYRVVLTDGTQLKLSRTYRDELCGRMRTSDR